MSEVLFWSSAAVIAETYLVFPATIAARGRWRARPPLADDVTPSVTVVVAAHDEGAGIAAKLASVLSGSYPPNLLDVVVASDGSADDTVEQASIDDPRVQVLDLPRLGKAGALNAAIAAAGGEIVVFTDANSRFAPDTLARLVRPFADPTVGGVAGDQRYDRGEPGAPIDATVDGERRYWDLDRWLKQAESAAGNVIGATGALYAVRRELIDEVPDGVTDDFTTSTGVIARGHRLVFAPDAAVYEPVSTSVDAEFRRKVRIVTRGLRGVAHRRELLDPRAHGFYSYQLLNHKVLRRLMAFPLATLLLASIGASRRSPFYRLALVGQLGVYVPAAIALAAPRSRLGRSRPCGMAAYFCLVNAAGAVGAWNLLTGRQIDRWTPDRQSPVAPVADPEAVAS
ncbi:glycosyltransferase family 2 protein [soil metagenome]